MKSQLRIFVLFFLVFALSACVPQHHYENYAKAMRYKIHKYGPESARELKPYFRRAGVAYPPKRLAILVFKNTKRMELWAKASGPWRFIKSYRVRAASGGPGPKLRDDDYQVPEGIYRIVELNPDSMFDLSMEINYPNAFDRYHARLDGRRNLGDHIFIHGNHLSAGCIAIGNDNIQQLFPLVYKVGRRHVEVIIAPNDLRYQKPIYGRERLRWQPTLYANIKRALQPFQNRER